MNLLPLKLARPQEVPLLKMAGYAVLASWNQSFVLMARETKSPVSENRVPDLQTENAD